MTGKVGLDELKTTPLPEPMNKRANKLRIAEPTVRHSDLPEWADPSCAMEQKDRQKASSGKVSNTETTEERPPV